MRGLGDVVAAVAKSVGLEQKPGCGCAKRQETLNRWVPLGKRRDPLSVQQYRGKYRGQVPIISGGSSCTPGTDCYCDCARHTTGLFKNANCQAKGIQGDSSALLLCEDWEAPSLTSSSGAGNGAPYYGPWYDNIGFNQLRGFNSYWTHTYNTGSSGFWTLNEPTNPTFGVPCSFAPGSAQGCGQAAWDPTDRWNGNSIAQLAILQNGQFNAEVAALTSPTGSAGGGSGVFDGANSFAHRNRPWPDNGTITGYKNWSQQRTVGITMAMAFPINLGTSRITLENWKFNEWPVINGGSAGDGMFLFGEAGRFGTTFPFYGFHFAEFSFSPSQRQAICAATRNGVQTAFGQTECDSEGTFLFRAGSNYTQSTHWPVGTWGCVRGFFQNIGLSNQSIEIWLTTAAIGSEMKIIDLANVNMTQFQVRNGSFGYTFDNYANANGSPTSAHTIETTYRYEDNIHIRAGAPVSCSQIGFGTGGSPPPPPAPTIVITSPTAASTFLTGSTPL